METPDAPAPAPAQPQPPLSPSDERTWAMLAHLSILANLITGGLGIIAALLIHLVYKDRSRYVAYQSLQAFLFQLIFWLGGWALVGLFWLISGLLSAVLVGCLLMPIAAALALIPLAALVYGVIAGIQCSQGEDFRYWLVWEWAQGALV